MDKNLPLSSIHMQACKKEKDLWQVDISKEKKCESLGIWTFPMGGV
jgi:hypothetical protein